MATKTHSFLACFASTALLACAVSDKSGEDDEDSGDTSIFGGGERSGLDAWLDTSQATELVRVDDNALAYTLTPQGCDRDGRDLVCEFDIFASAEAGQGWCNTCTDQTLNAEVRWTADGQLRLESIMLVSGRGMLEGVRIGSMDFPLTPSPPHNTDEITLVGGEVFGVDLTILQAGWILLEEGVGFVDATSTPHRDCRTYAYLDSTEQLDGGAVVTSCAGVGVVQFALTSGSLPQGADPYGSWGIQSLFVRDD